MAEYEAYLNRDFIHRRLEDIVGNRNLLGDETYKMEGLLSYALLGFKLAVDGQPRFRDNPTFADLVSSIKDSEELAEIMLNITDFGYDYGVSSKQRFPEKGRQELSFPNRLFIDNIVSYFGFRTKEVPLPNHNQPPQNYN